MSTFEDIQPEEFLAILKNFKIIIDETGTTILSDWINYLHRILHGKALREFYKLTSQNHGMTNSDCKHITEGLPEYLFPIISLSKQKRAMCCAMRKPWSILFKFLLQN